MTLAVQGKKGDERLIDYLMSEKFGLNWQDHDYVRMRDLQDIMFIVNREQNKSSKKRHGNSNTAYPRNDR